MPRTRLGKWIAASTASKSQKAAPDHASSLSTCRAKTTSRATTSCATSVSTAADDKVGSVSASASMTSLSAGDNKAAYSATHPSLVSSRTSQKSQQSPKSSGNEVTSAAATDTPEATTASTIINAEATPAADTLRAYGQQGQDRSAALELDNPQVEASSVAARAAAQAQALRTKSAKKAPSRRATTTKSSPAAPRGRAVALARARHAEPQQAAIYGQYGGQGRVQPHDSQDLHGATSDTSLLYPRGLSTPHYAQNMRSISVQQALGLSVGLRELLHPLRELWALLLALRVQGKSQQLWEYLEALLPQLHSTDHNGPLFLEAAAAYVSTIYQAPTQAAPELVTAPASQSPLASLPAPASDADVASTAPAPRSTALGAAALYDHASLEAEPFESAQVEASQGARMLTATSAATAVTATGKRGTLATSEDDAAREKGMALVPSAESGESFSALSSEEEASERSSPSQLLSQNGSVVSTVHRGSLPLRLNSTLQQDAVEHLLYGYLLHAFEHDRQSFRACALLAIFSSLTAQPMASYYRHKALELYAQQKSELTATHLKHILLSALARKNGSRSEVLLNRWFLDELNAYTQALWGTPLLSFASETNSDQEATADECAQGKATQLSAYRAHGVANTKAQHAPLGATQKTALDATSSYSLHAKQSSALSPRAIHASSSSSDNASVTSKVPRGSNSGYVAEACIRASLGSSAPANSSGLPALSSLVAQSEDALIAASSSRTKAPSGPQAITLELKAQYSTRWQSALHHALAKGPITLDQLSSTICEAYTQLRDLVQALEDADTDLGLALSTANIDASSAKREADYARAAVAYAAATSTAQTSAGGAANSIAASLDAVTASAATTVSATPLGQASPEAPLHPEMTLSEESKLNSIPEKLSSRSSMASIGTMEQALGAGAVNDATAAPQTHHDSAAILSASSAVQSQVSATIEAAQETGDGASGASELIPSAVESVELSDSSRALASTALTSLGDAKRAQAHDAADNGLTLGQEAPAPKDALDASVLGLEGAACATASSPSSNYLANPAQKAVSLAAHHAESAGSRSLHSHDSKRASQIASVAVAATSKDQPLSADTVASACAPQALTRENPHDLSLASRLGSEACPNNYTNKGGVAAVAATSQSSAASALSQAGSMASTADTSPAPEQATSNAQTPTVEPAFLALDSDTAAVGSKATTPKAKTSRDFYAPQHIAPAQSNGEAVSRLVSVDESYEEVEVGSALAPEAQVPPKAPSSATGEGALVYDAAQGEEDSRATIESSLEAITSAAFRAAATKPASYRSDPGAGAVESATVLDHALTAKVATAVSTSATPPTRALEDYAHQNIEAKNSDAKLAASAVSAGDAAPAGDGDEVSNVAASASYHAYAQAYPYTEESVEALALDSRGEDSHRDSTTAPDAVDTACKQASAPKSEIDRGSSWSLKPTELSFRQRLIILLELLRHRGGMVSLSYTERYAALRLLLAPESIEAHAPNQLANERATVTPNDKTPRTSASSSTSVQARAARATVTNKPDITLVSASTAAAASVVTAPAPYGQDSSGPILAASAASHCASSAGESSEVHSAVTSGASLSVQAVASGIAAAESHDAALSSDIAASTGLFATGAHREERFSPYDDRALSQTSVRDSGLTGYEHVSGASSVLHASGAYAAAISSLEEPSTPKGISSSQVPAHSSAVAATASSHTSATACHAAATAGFTSRVMSLEQLGAGAVYVSPSQASHSADSMAQPLGRDYGAGSATNRGTGAAASSDAVSILGFEVSSSSVSGSAYSMTHAAGSDSEEASSYTEPALSTTERALLQEAKSVSTISTAATASADAIAAYSGAPNPLPTPPESVLSYYEELLTSSSAPSLEERQRFQFQTLTLHPALAAATSSLASSVSAASLYPLQSSLAAPAPASVTGQNTSTVASAPSSAATAPASAAYAATSAHRGTDSHGAGGVNEASLAYLSTKAFTSSLEGAAFQPFPFATQTAPYGSSSSHNPVDSSTPVAVDTGTHMAIDSGSHKAHLSQDNTPAQTQTQWLHETASAARFVAAETAEGVSSDETSRVEIANHTTIISSAAASSIISDATAASASSSAAAATSMAAISANLAPAASSALGPDAVAVAAAQATPQGEIAVRENSGRYESGEKRGSHDSSLLGTGAVTGAMLSVPAETVAGSGEEGADSQSHSFLAVRSPITPTSVASASSGSTSSSGSFSYGNGLGVTTLSDYAFVPNSVSAAAADAASASAIGSDAATYGPSVESSLRPYALMPKALIRCDLSLLPLDPMSLVWLYQQLITLNPLLEEWGVGLCFAWRNEAVLGLNQANAVGIGLGMEKRLQRHSYKLSVHQHQEGSHTPQLREQRDLSSLGSLSSPVSSATLQSAHVAASSAHAPLASTAAAVSIASTTGYGGCGESGLAVSIEDDANGAGTATASTASVSFVANTTMGLAAVSADCWASFAALGLPVYVAGMANGYQLRDAALFSDPDLVLLLLPRRSFSFSYPDPPPVPLKLLTVWNKEPQAHSFSASDSGADAAALSSVTASASSSVASSSSSSSTYSAMAVGASAVASDVASEGAATSLSSASSAAFSALILCSVGSGTYGALLCGGGLLQHEGVRLLKWYEESSSGKGKRRLSSYESLVRWGPQFDVIVYAPHYSALWQRLRSSKDRRGRARKASMPESYAQNLVRTKLALTLGLSFVRYAVGSIQVCSSTEDFVSHTHGLYGIQYYAHTAQEASSVPTSAAAQSAIAGATTTTPSAGSSSSSASATEPQKTRGHVASSGLSGSGLSSAAAANVATIASSDAMSTSAARSQMQPAPLSQQGALGSVASGSSEASVSSFPSTITSYTSSSYSFSSRASGALSSAGLSMEVSGFGGLEEVARMQAHALSPWHSNADAGSALGLSYAQGVGAGAGIEALGESSALRELQQSCPQIPWQKCKQLSHISLQQPLCMSLSELQHLFAHSSLHSDYAYERLANRTYIYCYRERLSKRAISAYDRERPLRTDIYLGCTTYRALVDEYYRARIKHFHHTKLRNTELTSLRALGLEAGFVYFELSAQHAAESEAESETATSFTAAITTTRGASSDHAAQNGSSSSAPAASASLSLPPLGSADDSVPPKASAEAIETVVGSTSSAYEAQRVKSPLPPALETDGTHTGVLSCDSVGDVAAASASSARYGASFESSPHTSTATASASGASAHSEAAAHAGCSASTSNEVHQRDSVRATITSSTGGNRPVSQSPNLCTDERVATASSATAASDAWDAVEKYHLSGKHSVAAAQVEGEISAPAPATPSLIEFSPELLALMQAVHSALAQALGSSQLISGEGDAQGDLGTLVGTAGAAVGEPWGNGNAAGSYAGLPVATLTGYAIGTKYVYLDYVLYDKARFTQALEVLENSHQLQALGCGALHFHSFAREE